MVRLLRCLRETKANVAIIFALTAPLVVGGAGFGVETSYWYYKDLQLQAAADAAVWAAAIDKRSGSSSTVYTASAKDMATSNGFNPAIGTLEVNSPPKSGPNQNNEAVEVILHQPVYRFFSALFLKDDIVEKARAVATFKTASNACILALASTGSKDVLFSGNTNVQVKGCVVMSNSIDPAAITGQGSAIAKVDCLVSVGGVSITSSVTLGCPTPITGAPPVGDPYASLAAPTDPSNCKNGNGATLQPGNYCSGMTLKNNVTLKPGTYIVSGGDFQINANANVIGDGVTIYLVGTSRVSMNGNAKVTLSAPISGTYSGMLFFGDRSNNGTTKNTFNGTADSSLTGNIYFAKQPVNYLGNFSGQGGCTRIVAATIEWSGSTTVNQDCTAYGMQAVPATQLVHLAE